MSVLAPSAFRVAHFPVPRLTEADLVLLWEGQRFPPEALVSAEAGRLRVVYRGRRTGGPGPDFRDAIIATAGELLQGDVELHVRSSDFQRHGHHRDPAYDGVVLHVVFGHDAGQPTQLASGRRVPVAALGPWAAVRAEELRKRLAGPPLWQEPCYTALERLGSAAAATALDRLGDMRFRQKAAVVAREMGKREAEIGEAATEMGAGKGEREETEPALVPPPSPIRLPPFGRAALDDLLWEGILEVLGYGGQRELMRAVADGLPWGTLAGTIAGLPARERRPCAYRLLSGALGAARLRVPLVLRPLRPGNRPEARLKGASALAARFARRGLWPSLTPLLAEAAVGRPARLIAFFTVPGTIGRARAIEIICNAALPIAWAVGQESAAEAAFRALPLPARYGNVRHIRSALAGGVRLDARRQQGMLYLLKQYCTQGGCGRCPLS